MTRTFAGLGRYIQSAGALARLGGETVQHGSSAFVISGETVWELTAETVTESFEATAETVDRVQFSGECSTDEIARLTEAATDVRADIIVGIGGGKALDTAKSVAARRNLPVGSVPTIASTDSPTSSISVIYEDDGTFATAEQHRHHPTFVLVDT